MNKKIYPQIWYYSPLPMVGVKNKSSRSLFLFTLIVILFIFLNWQHEDFNFPDADVALLYVDGEVEADGVNVDFGVLAETDAEDFVGADCEIAGWGQTDGK